MLLLAHLVGRDAQADVALTGEHVPDLYPLDLAVESYKAAHPRAGGVLAVSKNGCIVYQRGFGGMPENAPMRIASIEKPFTAAIIRQLVAEGRLGLNDYAFELGQNWVWIESEGRWRHGGILPYQPRGELGDDRIKAITVGHLLEHQGGWYRNESGDFMFAARYIANQMDVPSPPARDVIATWALGRPLDFTPGAACSQRVDKNDPDSDYLPGCGDNYSNFGYMLLGLIIEQVTGMSVAENIRARLFTPDGWVPATDVYSGHTLPPDRGPREPAYLEDEWTSSVFDPGQTPHASYWYPGIVREPNGGWHLESMQGHGNLVSSAGPLLRFLDTYVIQGPDIGQRRDQANPIGVWAFGGALDGTNTLAVQRWDGINVVVLINDRDENDAGELAALVTKWIELNLSWPTRCVDGFWVEFGKPDSVHGSYDRPFGSMQNVLAETAAGSKVQLRPGRSGWSGVIAERMRLEAPSGPVAIGVP